MNYVSLYRRFRPDTFDKVVGQDHIVRTITNQIMGGRIGHAYLFTGTRGTGKTSCAKIMARAVNCLNPVKGSPCGKCEICKALYETENIDIIEMDAASNNGVDEIRDLRENAQYRPVYGKYKVYIIDEAHMLSGAAFNALLKTLEEPPPYVIFILATTEVQKLPQTILSRCMRFDFRLVDLETLINHLKGIFDELKVTYDEEAIRQIAIQGEGSVRDALSLADMCLSYCGKHIGYEDTLEILCASNFDTLNSLGESILAGDVKSALERSGEILKKGRNTLAKDLANYFMDLLEVKNTSSGKSDRISATQRKILQSAGKKYSNYRIARIMDIMAGMENAMRYSTQPRIILEANIVKACELITEVDVEGLVNRIRELEKEIAEMKEKGIALRVKDDDKKAITQAELDETELIIDALEDKKNDIGKLLEEMTEKKENIEVFDNAEEQESENDLIAMDIWCKVKSKLFEANEITLYYALENEDKGISMKDSHLTLTTANKVTYNLFMNNNDYVKLVQKVLSEVCGRDCVFECILFEEKNQKVSKEHKVLLTDLFGGQVKFD